MILLEDQLENLLVLWWVSSVMMVVWLISGGMLVVSEFLAVYLWLYVLLLINWCWPKWFLVVLCWNHLVLMVWWWWFCGSGRLPGEGLCVDLIVWWFFQGTFWVSYDLRVLMLIFIDFCSRFMQWWFCRFRWSAGGFVGLDDPLTVVLNQIMRLWSIGSVDMVVTLLILMVLVFI